jgi:hypothetical protein
MLACISFFILLMIVVTWSTCVAVEVLDKKADV